MPECKGKTLEQVDYLFQRNVPLRKFKDHDFEGIILDGDWEKAAAAKEPSIELKHVGAGGSA